MMPSDVCLASVAYIRSAGWRVLADWARPAWLKAARFCCRPGRGHIVAAARLQLVIVVSFSTIYRWYRSRGLIAKQTKKDGWLKVWVDITFKRLMQQDGIESLQSDRE